MKKLEIIATWGPGRRAQVTIVELQLQMEPHEADQLATSVQQLSKLLPGKLAALGLDTDPPGKKDLNGAGNSERTGAIEQLAGYLCHTALVLQRAAGFQVQFEDFLAAGDPARAQEPFRVIFEHDDASTGVLAADLALWILSDTCSRLAWTPEHHEPSESIESSVNAFVESARQLVASPDITDLAEAARQRGIPVIRLEREPYEPVRAEFRVAPNGLMMLGQACHQVVLDGPFVIGRPGAAFSLMKDRRLVWRLAASLGVKTPAREMDLLSCTSLSRARRVARRLGFPLRLWPLQRDAKAIEGWPVKDEERLEELFSRPSLQNRTFLLEPEAGRATLDLVFANGRLMHALENGHPQPVEPALEELAGRIAPAVGSGLLLIRFDTDSGYTLRHLDPAPSLRHLYADQHELRQQVLQGFLDWVFPPGTAARIPIIAVTGTNGKTTTTTMISRMAQAQGRNVGMAQTGGVYFNGELQEFGDLSAFMGHCKVFENREVDMAVLETARGGLASLGFTFERCDVAVCTNVTADHLGQLGIDTVEQMAEIKRSLLERSDKAVVLNGDNALCVDMLPFLADKKICLSTLKYTAPQLRERTLADIDVVNLEKIDGEDWIVLHELELGRDQRRPVMPVNEIPATFMGRARHNVSNAMHAIAAARAAGLGPEAIVSALSEFEMSFESLPGRLNMHDNGRYTIIMDYAHNADGIRQLVRFTDQFPCKGRKILRFGISPEASESSALAVAAMAAGHFDVYVCSGKPGAEDSEINHAEILKQGLEANGVSSDVITVTANAEESFNYPVSLCEPGDLLVLVTSRTTLAKTWQKILVTR